MAGNRGSLKGFQTIAAGSMAGNLISKVTNIQDMNFVRVDFFIASGTPTGSVDVQISHDYKQNIDGTVATAGTWASYKGSPVAVSGGSPALASFEVNSGAPWIRTIYTSTSGTGTANAYISGKS